MEEADHEDEDEDVDGGGRPSSSIIRRNRRPNFRWN